MSENIITAIQETVTSPFVTRMWKVVLHSKEGTEIESFKRKMCF
jgi:hypothetical protein